MPNPLIEKELERLVRDFTTVIPKEKSLVRAELLRFARIVIEEAMPERYDTEGTLLDVYREQYEDGFNACRQEILENVEKILRDNK